jgi:hypothetical protein
MAVPSVPRPPDPDRFWSDATVVVAPEDPRPGAWVGAPSVQLVDGVWWLAYRDRQPVGEGRGVGNVLARSDDGVTFTPVARVDKDRFGAESLERPALVRTPEGRWRLYVSCATPGTKHWRVDLLEAATVDGLASAEPRTVLPGSVTEGVKDPVVRHDGRQWHLWASVHPLDDPDATDRMTTEHAPTAEENWEERTGLARGDVDGRFTAEPGGPLLRSPHPPHGLRYVDVVAVPGGGARWFYEATRPDGAHELRTVLRPA